jgi:hypothetical protein
MIRYPLEYLEAVLNVEASRQAIARAHALRMALEDRKERESAKLSRFLPIEVWTKAWFIHDTAQIPICRGWPREEQTTPTHYVENRISLSPTLHSEWEPIYEIKSCTAGALHDYLRAKNGREPTLNPVRYGERIVEDEDGVQYRFVSMPTLRIPSPKDLEKMFTQLHGEKVHG